MSAKNRGAVTKDYDFYATPLIAITKFLEKYDVDMNNKSVLEPCAGNGSISKEIKNKYPNCKLHQIEIREEEEESLSQFGSVDIDNFLSYETNEKYDFIVTNPPYTYAREFIEKCFELSHENTQIAMLLRLNFLGSKKRQDFWSKYPVDHLYVLSSRPSFTGKGTDATEYAWFVWNAGSKNIVVV